MSIHEIQIQQQQTSQEKIELKSNMTKLPLPTEQNYQNNFSNKENLRYSSKELENMSCLKLVAYANKLGIWNFYQKEVKKINLIDQNTMVKIKTLGDLKQQLKDIVENFEKLQAEKLISDDDAVSFIQGINELNIEIHMLALPNTSEERKILEKIILDSQNS